MLNSQLINSGPAIDRIKRLGITDARKDSGIALTASAGGGAFGISNTTGSTLCLLSEAANSSTITDKALWEFQVSELFSPSQASTLTFNAQTTLAASATVSTQTIAASLYTISTAGVYSANLLSNSTVTLSTAATDYSVPVASTAAVQPGWRLILELTAVVTETAGHNATAQINGIRINQ